MNTAHDSETKPAHTPGPWFANGPCDVVAKNTEGYGYIVVCHLTHTAQSLREKEANAKLIATAPDLLKAAELVLKYIDQFGTHTDDRRVTALRFAVLEAQGVMDAGSARAAITKATGGAK